MKTYFSPKYKIPYTFDNEELRRDLGSIIGIDAEVEFQNIIEAELAALDEKYAALNATSEDGK